MLYLNIRKGSLRIGCFRYELPVHLSHHINFIVANDLGHFCCPLEFFKCNRDEIWKYNEMTPTPTTKFSSSFKNRLRGAHTEKLYLAINGIRFRCIVIKRDRDTELKCTHRTHTEKQVPADDLDLCKFRHLFLELKNCLCSSHTVFI